MEQKDTRKWNIKIIVPDADFTTDLVFNPLITIGSVIMELAPFLPKKFPVTKYDLWNSSKGEWLNNRRQTLIGYDMKNEAVLHFIKSWVNVYLILPSMEMICMEVCIATKAFSSIKYICEKLQLRCYEEISLRKLQKTSPEVYKSMTAPINDSVKYIDNPAYAKSVVTRVNFKMNPELEKEFPDLMGETYKWCNFYESWIDTHRPLKQQGVEEGSILQLRYKFYKFLDFDKKKEIQRITQIFMQAFWTLRTQELQVSDENLSHFASMAWHIYTLKQKEIYIGDDESEGDIDNDDIDEAIERLEMKLERDFSKMNKGTNETTNMSEEFNIVKCSNNKVKLKNHHCSLIGTRLQLTYSKEEKSETYEMEVRGARIKWVVKPLKDIYRIKIKQFNENLDDQCTFKSVTLHTAVRPIFNAWLPAIRYASKNISTNYRFYDISVGCTQAFVKLKVSCDECFNKNTNSYQSNYLCIDDLYPKSYFKKRTKDEVCDQLYIEQESCFKLSLEETMLSFIRKWLGIKNFDVATFSAIFPKENTNKKEEIVGISSSSFYRINPKTNEIIKEWPLSKLKQWSVNWSNKQQVLKFSDHTVYVSLPHCNVSILHEYIGGYIFMQLRKDSSDILDITMWNKLTSSQ